MAEFALNLAIRTNSESVSKRRTLLQFQTYYHQARRTLRKSASGKKQGSEISWNDPTADIRARATRVLEGV